MATILKCKMCGGDIEVNQDMSVGTCMFCGSTMTLPRIDNEKKARLFNRANEYRLNNEFDKAYDAYRAIVDEDEQESEAYWGMILSEYGVEYVEDPTTKKRIPTCHRTKIQSIQSSTNYELACKYADAESKFIFQDEAEALDKIQKKILSISSKEEPYDVFICYKETDNETGERTKDSTIAQDIYNELNREGLKVFFSRITLEDKLGQDYEPYIFSALSSSKVMLVVTTSNENANSVWVKNEWSRYLKFMQDDTRKVIIPVYQGMEVYELPDELSKFQAQRYDKVGAIQDITHSVKKLVSIEERQHKDSVIEDIIQDRIKEEQKKNEKIVKRKKTAVLIRKIAFVTGILLLFGGLIYGGVMYYKNTIKPSMIYKDAVSLRQSGEYEQAKEKFCLIPGYKDSDEQMIECWYYIVLGVYESGDTEKAKELFSTLAENEDSKNATKEFRYSLAKECIDKAEYSAAMYILEGIMDYGDGSDLYSLCKFKKAQIVYDSGDYENAYKAFSNVGYGSSWDEAKEYMIKCKYEIQMGMDTRYGHLGNYSKVMSEEMIYNMGTHMMDVKQYEYAKEFYSNCIQFSDSIEMWKKAAYFGIKDNSESTAKMRDLYDIANGDSLKDVLESKGANMGDIALSYEPAQKDFELLADKYYKNAMEEYNATNWGTALKAFRQFNNMSYKDVSEMIQKCKDNIENEKSKYDGIWKNNSGWTNLKISDGKVYECSGIENFANPNIQWESVTRSNYDEDSGELSFSHWEGHTYDVIVNGNSLTIKCTNLKDQWDSDWFGNSNRFTRYSK